MTKNLKVNLHDFSEKVVLSSTIEDVAKALSEKTKLTECPLSYREAANVINLLSDTVHEELAKGKRVQLTGFVTFEYSFRKSREGNNVFTGERMTIPDAVVINAKPGKHMKDAIKELPADKFKEIRDKALNGK